MSISFQCSGCGKPYVLDDGLAGKKAKCKQCGELMRVPEPGAFEPAGTTTAAVIRFRCESCGKSYSTPAHLAGKKIACKGCGRSVKIPGEHSTATANPKSKPELKFDPDGPAPIDIYGLADDEVPTNKGPIGDGILADEPSRPARVGAASETDDDGPLPSRAGYEPMTEAKKKKLEKRVKDVEKTNTSYAGAAYGVSFSTILAVTLFGWRFYRKIERNLDRMADRHVVATAEADPRTTSAAMDRNVAEQVRQSDTAEARDWLDTAKHPNHSVMEMPTDRARAMVDGFYERGAETVYVLDPSPIGKTVLTAAFAVKLPTDLEQRKKCLEWETQYLQGEEPTRDFGQTYLMITTD